MGPQRVPGKMVPAHRGPRGRTKGWMASKGTQCHQGSRPLENLGEVKQLWMPGEVTSQV